MPYKIAHHNAFEKGLKKLNPQNLSEIIKVCDNIQSNPSIGDIMHAHFKKEGIKKVKVKKTNPEYRILYKLYKCDKKNEKTLVCSQQVPHVSKTELMDCNGLVDLIICGPREMFNNFYKLPLDKLKKYL